MNTIKIGTKLLVVKTQRTFTVVDVNVAYGLFGPHVDLVLQDCGETTPITTELINEMICNAEMLVVY